MKKLEELGISTPPWKAKADLWYTPFTDHEHSTADVICADHSDILTSQVAMFDGDKAKSDVILASAAPDMYKSECDLIEAVELVLDTLDEHCDCTAIYGVAAALEAAKEAVAKAAGEEPAND